MAEHNALIDRIKKLFAMAQRATNNDGSSNEAEAAAAMAKAQELLTKYNLDMKTIQDSATPGSAAAQGGKREQQTVKRSAQYKWQQQFWAALAVANFCWHWVVTVREDHKSSRTGRDYRMAKRHVVLGSEANVAAVVAMGEYLTETIERLLPYPQSERLSKAALSWREGCAERLIERITAKKAEMAKGFTTESGEQCTALAVQSLEDQEYAANYDAKYGAGAYARKLRRDAEWEANTAQREKEWEARTQLYQAQREALIASETPAERKKRIAKEAREEARAYQRYQREQEREAARLDFRAYNAGRSKAEEINLNDQLKER